MPIRDAYQSTHQGCPSGMPIREAFSVMPISLPIRDAYQGGLFCDAYQSTHQGCLSGMLSGTCRYAE